MIATSLAAALAVLAPTPQDAGIGQPVPYSAVSQTVPGYTATYQGRMLNDQDTALFRQGLAAARARDVSGARSAISQLRDPTARKLVEWALIDTSGDQLSYAELAQADSALAGWPRAESRRGAVEKALDLSGAGPDAALTLFADQPPETIEGVIAYASALEQRGRRNEAQALIRDWWRTRSFDEAPQSRILARWGGSLTPADHETRLNLLLLGPHGPATRAMIGLVSPERAAVANAVMSLRTAYSPDAVVAGLPPAQSADPAVVLERVRILRSQNRQSEAFP
ncbi:lytic transglycosylase domain-containing protein, partial [Pseudomonas sp. ODNR1LW]|nr:lytic transglycosylase domain-containing protein [Pseudomonas sp. ODNR1LW]